MTLRDWDWDWDVVAVEVEKNDFVADEDKRCCDWDESKRLSACDDEVGIMTVWLNS